MEVSTVISGVDIEDMKPEQWTIDWLSTTSGKWEDMGVVASSREVAVKMVLIYKQLWPTLEYRIREGVP